MTLLPSAVRFTPTRLLVRLRRVVLILFVLVALFIAFLLIHLVPPIWVKVVDATTGKPVAGMDVCMEVTVKDWETGKTLRIESTQTNSRGNFWISPSIHVLEFFQSWRGYTIRISDRHLNTDGNPDVHPACGEPHNSIAVITESQVPTISSSDWPVYFPVTLVKQPTQQIPTGYGAYSRDMAFPFGGKVALVPLLKSRNGCPPTKDPTWVAYCRDENNSWLAYQLRARSGATDAQ